MMLALEMFRSLPRTVAGKAMGARMPGILSGYAAPLRLVTIDPPKVDRPGLGPAALAAVRHLRLRPRRAVRARPRSTSPRSCRCRSCPATRWSPSCSRTARTCQAGTRVVARPGADLRGPRRRAVRELRGRPHQPLLADHRRPPRARAADRVLQGHRRRLGPAAGRAPQPDARGARGLVGRAGAAHGAALVRGAHRAAGRRHARTTGCSSAAPDRSACSRRWRCASSPRPARSSWSPSTATSASWRWSSARPRWCSPARCCAAYAARPARSSSSRSSPRRTSSAASTSPSTRSAASSRWRPRCNATRAGGRVVLSGMPAAADLSRRVVPRARGGRHLRLVPAGGRTAAVPSTSRPSWSSRPRRPASSKSVASYPLHRWREALDHAHCGRPSRYGEGRVRPEESQSDE